MMKTVVLALIGFGLCLSARATTLATVDGATYNNITTQRVDPDGLYIEYTMPGGGVGMSKVKFSRLSSDQQKQFGFDASKARDYELSVAKATEDYRQESLRTEQIAQAARQVRDAQNEQAANQRLVAQAQANAAQAVPPYDNWANYGYSSLGGGYGLYAIPRTGPAPPAKRVYAPIVTPIPFPKVGLPKSYR